MSDFLRSSSPWTVGDILPSPIIDPDPSPGSLGLAFISSHAVPAVATVATVFSPKPLWGSQETLLDFFLSWPLQRTLTGRRLCCTRDDPVSSLSDCLMRKHCAKIEACILASENR